jgi:hypothetical protein
VLTLRLFWEKTVAWWHGWQVRTEHREIFVDATHWSACWALVFPPQLVERTKKVWSKHLGRPVTDDEAQYILKDFSRFFSTLRAIKAVRNGK